MTSRTIRCRESSEVGGAPVGAVTHGFESNLDDANCG